MIPPDPNSRILAQHTGSYMANRYPYLHDRLGSARRIIDASGMVKKLCSYNPFGELLEEDETFDFKDSEYNKLDDLRNQTAKMLYGLINYIEKEAKAL